MNKRIVLGLTAALIIVIGVFLFTKSTNLPSMEEGQVLREVKSNDGIVAVRIPVGATTEEEAARVTVKKKESNDGSLVYSLEPEGMEFARPVFIEFRQPIQKDGENILVPRLMHTWGEGEQESFEPVSTESTVDLEAGMIVTKGAIMHFSDIRYTEAFFSVVPRTTVFRHKIGETFETYSVAWPHYGAAGHSGSEREGKRDRSWSSKPEGTWSFVATLSFLPDDKISPKEIELSAGNLTESEKIDLNGNFRCTGEDDYAPLKTKVEFRYTQVTRSVRYIEPSIIEFWKTSPWVSDAESRNTTDTVYLTETHRCLDGASSSSSSSKSSSSSSKSSSSLKSSSSTSSKSSMMSSAISSTASVASSKGIEEVGTMSVGSTDKYYVVKSTDPTGDTGDEVCAKAGKKCVGYTDLTLGSCLKHHPGALTSEDFNGSKAGFFCDGPPQGGICAQEHGTCHICPNCNLNMACDTRIGDFYRETYVECQ